MMKGRAAKNILFVMIVFITAASCNNTDAGTVAIMNDTANYTAIQWLDTLKSFDTIRMGEQVKLTFRFKNSGTKALYLTEVKPGCGCTASNYTHGTIAPGKEGVVTGEFDSNKSHTGPVTKQLFVTSNTYGGTKDTLTFTGVIKEK